eukprot:1154661-Pelagomonas_calceolata.AAC.7
MQSHAAEWRRLTCTKGLGEPSRNQSLVIGPEVWHSDKKSTNLHHQRVHHFGHDIQEVAVRRGG